MEPFYRVTGPAAPLARDNVDTDVIIRIERLAELDRNALGSYAFEALRYRADGSEDPDFILNQVAYRDAPVLLAGENFGCGSSREGAVWALASCGIRCVIAKSFGGIFANNCYQNGVLPIALSGDCVDALTVRTLDSAGAAFTVDLDAKTIEPPGGEPITFSIDGLRRRALLAGLDDLGLTLQITDAIGSFQQRDRIARPWIWQRSLLPNTSGNKR